MEEIRKTESESNSSLPLSTVKSAIVLKFSVINAFLEANGKDLKVHVPELNTSFYPVQVNAKDGNIHTIVQSEGRISATIELVLNASIKETFIGFDILDINMGASKSIHKLAFRLAKNQIQKKIQERLDFEIRKIPGVIEKKMLPITSNSGQQIGLEPTLHLRGIEFSTLNVKETEINIQYQVNFESQVEINDIQKIWQLANANLPTKLTSK